MASRCENLLLRSLGRILAFHLLCPGCALDVRFLCLAGVDIEEIGKGRIFRGYKGYLEGILEILPLYKSKEKLQKTYQQIRKAKEKLRKTYFSLVVLVFLLRFWPLRFVSPLSFEMTRRLCRRVISEDVPAILI